jgi:hypothetical protein
MKSTLTLLFGLLLFSTLHAQVPAYVPTDGLVGWWPFNGNANDYSGNGNDGNAINMEWGLDRNNVPNAAANFDLVSNRVVEILNPIGVYGDSKSISVWFKIPNTINSGSYYNSMVIGGTPFGGPLTEIECMIYGNWPDYITGGYVNKVGFSSNPPANLDVADEDWHHAVFNVDGVLDLLSIYIDGSLIQTLSIPQYNCSNWSSLTFGNWPAFNAPYQTIFAGSLDDIAIFNQPLTEQEIQNLYTGLTPQPPCVSLPSNLQQGLAGYWPFCGDANDESGNGNDGVVNGATLTEDRFGNAASAYSFDGVDDDIDITNLSINGDVSVSFWKRIENMNFSYPIGLGINPIFNVGFGIGIGFLSSGCGNQDQDSTLFVYDGADGCSNVMLSAPFLVEGVWYHTSFVRENGVSKLYENGSLIAESVNLDFPTFSNITFGRRSDNMYPFNGLLDDIAIWNRALTPEEVQELCTLDACTFTVYDTVTVENVVTVYDTLTIENIVDVFDTTYVTMEVYDTLTVENVINVYDTLTVENVIDVYDTTFVTVTDTLVIDVLTGIGSGSALNTLLLYPNPTSDQLTIDYGNIAAMAGYSLSIFNNGGSAVHETLITQSQETLDISGWSSGVYQVVVYNAGGVPVETRQIVIQ